MMKLRGLSLLLGLALFLSACGDSKVQGSMGKDRGGDRDGSTSDVVLPDGAVEIEQGVYVVPGIHIRPGIEIYEIGPEFADDLKLDNEVFTAELSGAAAAEAADIKVGDILMTNEVIARVAAVSNVSGVITVTLEDFMLWDVVHGEWSLEIELDRDEGDVYPISPDDYAVRHQLLSQSVNVGGSYSVGSLKLSANASATVSLNPSFTFQGKIPFYESKSNYHCANPQIDTRVLFKKFTYCIDYLKLAVVGSNESQSSVSVSATAEAKAAYPSNDHKRAFSKPLGEIPVAGPFSLKPSLYIDSQFLASAKATATLEFSSTSGASVPVGFEYRNGGGFSMLPNAGNPGSRHSTLSGSVKAEGTLEASVYAELGLAMSVCTTGSTLAGACFEGLSAGARLTTKAQYKDSISLDGPSQSACLTMSTDLAVNLTGKVKAGVTAAAGTFEKSVVLFEASFPAYSTNIRKWDDGGKYCLTGMTHQMHVDSLNDQYDVDIDCKEPAENPLIGTCAEKFMIHCFDPEGECKGLAYEDGSFDMNWASGEKYLSTVSAFKEIMPGVELPSELLGEYLDIDGELCAEQKSTIALMSGGGGDCMVTAIITLKQDDDGACEEGEECEESEEGEEGEDGEELRKEGDILKICAFESGDLEYTCPDDTTFTVSGDNAGKICQQGTCTFEKGFLAERDENRE